MVSSGSADGTANRASSKTMQAHYLSTILSILYVAFPVMHKRFYPSIRGQIFLEPSGDYLLPDPLLMEPPQKKCSHYLSTFLVIPTYSYYIKVLVSASQTSFRTIPDNQKQMFLFSFSISPLHMNMSETRSQFKSAANITQTLPNLYFASLFTPYAGHH